MTRPGTLPLLKYPDNFIDFPPTDPGETEVDDMGYEYELCPENDNGHLYHLGWCLHCNSEEP
jgi:hypothetical protein